MPQLSPQPPLTFSTPEPPAILPLSDPQEIPHIPKHLLVRL